MDAEKVIGAQERSRLEIHVWVSSPKRVFRAMILDEIAKGGSVYRKEKRSKGAWVAQSVRYPTLGFSSGHDLTGL